MFLPAFSPGVVKHLVLLASLPATPLFPRCAFSRELPAEGLRGLRTCLLSRSAVKKGLRVPSLCNGLLARHCFRRCRIERNLRPYVSLKVFDRLLSYLGEQRSLRKKKMFSVTRNARPLDSVSQLFKAFSFGRFVMR